ncbi:MAG TPA: hypothetical protein VLJ17_13290 [Xanthobacteraceae bacterium]|nr:hypothetical protein [Xanthobacteraceae bacterium]
MAIKPKLRKEAAALALALLLAGCASTGGTGALTVTGNELGGKIPSGMSDVPSAINAATAHCAKYNKKAALTVMQTQAQGGAVAFICR